MKPMWSEGQFMMPQHFQLMEQYQEQLVEDRLRALTPLSWGLLQMEVDRDALVRGIFKLDRCVAILPDGLLVRIGPEEPLDGCKVTTPSQAAAVADIEIFLGVPSDVTRGSSTYAAERGTAGARYQKVSLEARDAYGVAEPCELDCVRPNAQLLLGSDDRRDFICFKLAELSLAENGTLTVSDAYIPPTVQIRASSYLMRRLAQLVKQISGKQQVLTDLYRGRSGSVVEFSASDTLTLLCLDAVNGTLARLMHYADSGHVHPEQLYLELCQLGGRLAAIGVVSRPQDFPRYVHTDLAKSLPSLFETISTMLEATLAPRFTTIPLESGQRGLFVGRVKDETLLKSSQLFLVASGDVPGSKLRDELPRYVKISSLDQIAKVVQAALPAVEAQVDLSPPPTLPVKAESVYMRLEQRGSHWDEILKSNTIAIYQPVSPDHVKLELLAIAR